MKIYIIMIKENKSTHNLTSVLDSQLANKNSVMKIQNHYKLKIFSKTEVKL